MCFLTLKTFKLSEKLVHFVIFSHRYKVGVKSVDQLSQLTPGQLISLIRSNLGLFPMHSAMSILRGANKLAKKRAK